MKMGPFFERCWSASNTFLIVQRPGQLMAIAYRFGLTTGARLGSRQLNSRLSLRGVIDLDILEGLNIFFSDESDALPWNWAANDEYMQCKIFLLYHHWWQ